MKKHILIILTVCVWAFAFNFIQINCAAEEMTHTVFSDDFEGYRKDVNVVNIGSDWSDKYVQETNNTRYIRNAEDLDLPNGAEHGNVFERGTKNTKNNFWRLSIQRDDPQSGPIAAASANYSAFKKVWFGYDFLLTDRYARSLNIVTNTGSIANVAVAYITEDGCLSSAQNTEEKAEYLLNDWNSIGIEIDFETQRYAIYLNGETVSENNELPASIDRLQSFGISELKSADEESEHLMYIDNIAVKTFPKLEVKTLSIQNGNTDVPVHDGMRIEFNYRLAALAEGNIAVTKTRQRLSAENAIITCDGNTADISFAGGMDFETEYYIYISKELSAQNGQKTENDDEICFKTEKKGLTAEKISLTSGGIQLLALPADGEITAETTVYNPFDENKTSAIYIAVYNTDGTLDTMEKSTVTEIAGLSGTSVQTSISSDSYENKYVKAFILDENMQLIRSDFLYMGADDVKNYALKSENTRLAFENEPSAADGILSFSAKYEREGYAAALIILNKAGKAVFAEPVYTDEAGKLSYSCKIDAGYYELVILGRNTENILKKEVLYLPDSEKQSIIQDINSAECFEQFKDKAENYAENKLLLIDDDVRTENNYLIAYEQRKKNDTYDKFISQIKTAGQLFAQINAADWEALYNLLNENGKVILNDTDLTDELYDRYFEKSAQDKQAIAKAVVRKEGYNGFYAFRKAFSEALDTYKTPAVKEENKGGGSVSGRVPLGGGGGGIPAANENSSENNTVSAFNDLESTPWANEAIEALLKADIISKSEDKAYRPNDKITRAEFVKLIVKLLKIEINTGESGFNDVSENMWYAPYLSAAKRAGIINGRGDNSFGADESITRQDMAKIAYGAVTANKNVLTSNAPKNTFSDNDKIAPYAQEAVNAMQSAGIIKGMENGAFMPAENTTRAEAAVIIYRIANVLKEAA